MTLSYSYSVYFALKTVLLELLCLSPLNRCITQAFVMSPLNSLMKLNHDNYTIMHHMIQFVFILSFGSLSHFPWWVYGQLDIAIVISCNSARVFPWHASEIIEYIIIYLADISRIKYFPFLFWKLFVVSEWFFLHHLAPMICLVFRSTIRYFSMARH